MTHSKKIDYIDALIFRFSLPRKKPELGNICEQEMLESNFFSKDKNAQKYSALAISFLLRDNLIHKVWVNLINERQHKTRGFLGKISKSHGINLSWGQ